MSRTYIVIALDVLDFRYVQGVNEWKFYQRLKFGKKNLNDLA